MLTTPLEQLVTTCVEKQGAHVIEVIVKGHQQRPLLEVYVDTEAGVTTELCSAISKEIHSVLRVRPLLGPLVQLTVSSPGIERPLRYLWQYRKHIGRDLTVQVTAGETGEEHTGRLAAVDGESIVLEPGVPGEQHRFPFDTIVRAVVKTPW
jgi:ribosome maturation factor RimP